MNIYEFRCNHVNIELIYKLESNNKLPSLDITRISNNEVKTSFYRKPTNTNIYITWHFDAPSIWKIETLENLIKSEKHVCFSKLLLKNSINYLRKTFTECNHYPLKVVNGLIDQEFLQLAQQEIVERKNLQILQNTHLMAPYSGKQGHKLL